MTEFYDRVVAEIKRNFPNVEFIAIGDGNTGEGFAWTHASITHESAQVSAEDMVIDTLSDRIKDLKEPHITVSAAFSVKFHDQSQALIEFKLWYKS